MANIAVSEKSLTVLNYLRKVTESNPDANLTAADIAKELGMERKSVDGIITSGLQRKGYTQRVPAWIEYEEEVDGEVITKNKEVKFIKLTDKGINYDHEAALRADMEAKMAKATEKAE